MFGVWYLGIVVGVVYVGGYVELGGVVVVVDVDVDFVGEIVGVLVYCGCFVFGYCFVVVG